MSATPTPSDGAGTEHHPARALREIRHRVLAQPDRSAAAVRSALANGYDEWLIDTLPDRAGIALIAVGGLGRRELAPYSDLDLVLLHNKGMAGVAEVADALWYPIWDARIGLDHSVRTVDQALHVAGADMKAMLSLLDLRHIAGDAALSGELRERALQQWRATAARRVSELAELCRARGASVGEVGFALEPEVKQGRGGLRDWHALRALAMAQLLDISEPVRAGSGLLLDVRGELHRVVGSAVDVLRLQEQAAVAAGTGMDNDDDLLRAVNEAGRTVSAALDRAWRQVPTTRRRASRLPWRSATARRPVAHNVVSQDGEIVLALDADPWVDPALPLRAARAAAEQDEPLAPFTLDRLVSETAPLAEPWPDEARAEFVGLLGAGRTAVAVLESLDQAGLLTRMFPEWEHVRFAPQRNPVHRFTVERHLMETAAQAAELTRGVRRPDLLLVGAFFHDIGKGLPGDHSVVGAELAESIALRMGFAADDVRHIVALVRHHLLLPNTATRRDLDDPKTIEIVTGALDGSVDLLDELAALTRADAAATGPAAWSEWKGALVAELVGRARAAVAGEPLPTSRAELDDARTALADAGVLAVERAGPQLLVAAPDAPGLLSLTAGVLALHSLDVRSAIVSTHRGMAVNAFVAIPRFGSFPDLTALREDLSRAVDGVLPLATRLSEKDAAYADTGRVHRPPPEVLWFDAEATAATIVEIRADDAFGLLHRLTAALDASALDVRSARISTLGGSAVDAFYVTGTDGGAVPAETRRAATRRLLAAAR